MSLFHHCTQCTFLRPHTVFLSQLKLAETYEPLLPWFRESELRHGRTAMLAVLGFITTDFIRIPGEAYSFEAIPKTVDAHNILIEKGPMVQLLFWVGLFDLVITCPACVATMKGEREPGGELDESSLFFVLAFEFVPAAMSCRGE
jgi:Chlorophyll A-B binding protein